MAITKQINQNLENIRSLILRNTRINKQVFQRTSLLKRRRGETLKRKAQETILESPNLVRNAIGRSFIAQSMARTGKGFLERIMGFLGYLTAGWIFNNLPTWIALGKEFIARIERGREIFSDFISSVKGTFSGMGKVLDAALTNLKELDFLDSKKRLEKEWANMTKQMNNIGKSVDDGYKLITTPLFDEERKGVYSGEKIPELNSEVEEEEEPTPQPQPQPQPTPQPQPQPTPLPQPQTTAPTPQSSSAGGWGPILDVISRAESRRDGYNAIAPGDYHPRLSKMTLQEAYKVRGVRRGGAGALGRYQFTDPFFEKASYAGLGPNDIFSPTNQDKMAIALSRVQVGVTLDSIKNDPISAGDLLAQIWAGLPLLSGPNKGKSYYEGQYGNKATITVQEYETALRKVAGTPKAQVQPQIPRVPQGQSKFESDIMDFRKFRGKQFGAPSERFATPNPDYYQMREFGVFGSGNYNIHPMADDTNYEIHVHRGAGHRENRAMDIPVPPRSKEGDMVAEFWRKKGYDVIWNNGDGVHHNHVHVEVPKNKTAEFFALNRQMASLSMERKGPKVIVIEEEGAAVASSTKKEPDNVNLDMSMALNSFTKQNALTRLAYS